MGLSEPGAKSAPEGEKEKGAETNERHQSKQESEPKAGKEREADKDSYVKYDSNADQKSEPASQQNLEPEQDLSDVQKDWKAEMQTRREQQRGTERDGREDERKR